MASNAYWRPKVVRTFALTMSISNRCCARVGSRARRANRAPCHTLTARSRRLSAALASRSVTFVGNPMGLSERRAHLLQKSAWVLAVHHPDVLDRPIRGEKPGGE